MSCIYQRWFKLYIYSVGLFSFVKCMPSWIGLTSELLNEANELKLYKAVIDSMNEWQRKQKFKETNNRIKRDNPSVCYSDLGCFEASGPFGYLDMLPSKPEEVNTKFLLYPARNGRRRSSSAPTEVPFEKLEDAFKWAQSGFNKSLPTKILIHGFGSDCGYIWAYEIRSALMAVEEVNTICVDWSNGAALPNYVKASANTRLVGKQLSLLLRGLMKENGLSLRTTHLIGFSLGAHIAGFTGADLGNISRITGLDPAGPLFESQDIRARLDETDASFVDVIHSNGENIILGGLGTSQPMGHVDFYPNGGRMQKGCSHLFVGAVSDIIWSSAMEGRSLCNHRRAYKFFIDSISPRCHFPAFPCTSYDEFIVGKCFPCTEKRNCGNMGYYANRSKGRGQLYLITREEEPFCAHQYLVKLETLPSSKTVKSYGKIQITLIGESLLNETFMMTRKEDEEMNIGESISRILVPHPILSTPIKIQILYTAYSGWLSSGLTQWKIDKVTLMDSFGKMSSACKKSVLESGIAVTLNLYPGECSRSSFHKEEDDVFQYVESQYFKNENKNKSKEHRLTFLTTQNEENNPSSSDLKFNLKESTGILKNDKDNNLLDVKNKEIKTNLDDEVESSRSFDMKVKLNKSKIYLHNNQEIVHEIVEPILKPNFIKLSRARNPNNEKMEINEPILGPTISEKNNSIVNGESVNKLLEIRNESISFNVDKSNDLRDNFQDVIWHIKEDTEVLRKNNINETQNNDVKAENPQTLDGVVTTVQLLPNRLATMFEHAEKYARENILPFVSSYTPQFISEFIGTKQHSHYVPLHKKYIGEYSSPTEVSKRNDQQKNITVNSNTSNISGLQPIQTNFTEKSMSMSHSHIQKVLKSDNQITPYIFSIFLQSELDDLEPTKGKLLFNKTLDLTRKARKDNVIEVAKLNLRKKSIYIELPVFNENDKKGNYIPFNKGL